MAQKRLLDERARRLSTRGQFMYLWVGGFLALFFAACLLGGGLTATALTALTLLVAVVTIGVALAVTARGLERRARRRLAGEMLAFDRARADAVHRPRRLIEYAPAPPAGPPPAFTYINATPPEPGGLRPELTTPARRTRPAHAAEVVHAP